MNMNKMIWRMIWISLTVLLKKLSIHRKYEFERNNLAIYISYMYLFPTIFNR